MEKVITFVGMDTSKAAIKVAILFPEREVAVERGLANEASAVRRMVRQVQREAPDKVVFCYEAGVGGYALKRQIERLGSRCMVVAPSLIPTKRGDRVKTDRKDARGLVFLFRAGLLTEVRSPTREEEAARGLSRSREQLVSDRRRCRQRVKGLLLRHEYVYPGSQSWTGPYRRWLAGLKWESQVEQVVFDDYLLGLDQHEERLRQLEIRLVELSNQEPYRERAGWLRCFRGIDTVTAMTVLTEIHGIERFPSAPELMSYLGLVSSEFSSGEATRRGRITKTGNTHVRRMLVEAAHNYRRPASVRGALRKRREGQPGWVLAIADRAQQRLHRRFWRLVSSGKDSRVAAVAVARELVGFIWSALQGPPPAVASNR